MPAVPPVIKPHTLAVSVVCHPFTSDAIVAFTSVYVNVAERLSSLKEMHARFGVPPLLPELMTFLKASALEKVGTEQIFDCDEQPFDQFRMAMAIQLGEVSQYHLVAFARRGEVMPFELGDDLRGVRLPDSDTHKLYGTDETYWLCESWRWGGISPAKQARSHLQVVSSR